MTSIQPSISSNGLGSLTNTQETESKASVNRKLQILFQRIPRCSNLCSTKSKYNPEPGITKISAFHAGINDSLTDNNPVGEQVSTAMSNRRIGTITYTYDTPSNDKGYPAGYRHDLCLISDPSLPDVVSPPGYPPVIGWASYSEALDGKECYVVAQNFSTGNIRLIRGVTDLTLFCRAAVLGTGYSWDKLRKKCNAFLLWHTPTSVAPAVGTSGSPLCLGRPSDTVASAVVFQNFESLCYLAVWSGKIERKKNTNYTTIKGGFVLPPEFSDSTILSGEAPTSTALYNTLPSGNRASTENEHQRRVFSSFD